MVASQDSRATQLWEGAPGSKPLQHFDTVAQGLSRHFILKQKGLIMQAILTIFHYRFYCGLYHCFQVMINVATEENAIFISTILAYVILISKGRIEADCQ